MAVTSAVICTFLRSSVIGNNDLGWRGFLIAEFVLLLWAVDLFGDRERLPFLSPIQKQLLTVFFGLGFAGTACDLTLARLYPLLSDRGVTPVQAWISPDREFGHRAYAVRSAYEWLQTVTPERATVQANPKVVVNDVMGTIYSERRTVAGDMTCHSVFGGDPRECAPIAAKAAALFPANGAIPASEACSSLALDAVVVKDTDDVWRNPNSWVWREQPDYSNSYVRVYRCVKPSFRY
jgi:hypothetical protein